MARLAAIYRSSHSPKVTVPRSRYQPFAASPSASLRLLPSGSGRTEPTLGCQAKPRPLGAAAAAVPRGLGGLGHGGAVGWAVPMGAGREAEPEA